MSRSRFGGDAADGALNHDDPNAWSHMGGPEETKSIRNAQRTKEVKLNDTHLDNVRRKACLGHLEGKCCPILTSSCR